MLWLDLKSVNMIWCVQGPCLIIEGFPLKSMGIKVALGTAAAVGALFACRESRKQRAANNGEQVLEILHDMWILHVTYQTIHTDFRLHIDNLKHFCLRTVACMCGRADIHCDVAFILFTKHHNAGVPGFSPGRPVSCRVKQDTGPPGTCSLFK